MAKTKEIKYFQEWSPSVPALANKITAYANRTQQDVVSINLQEYDDKPYCSALVILEDADMPMFRTGGSL